MASKTMGQIAYEACVEGVSCWPKEPTFIRDSWEVIADAVITEYERRRADRGAQMETVESRLKAIITDLHWMARRYADGRTSYATGLFNDRTRECLSLGIPLNPTGDQTIWASDSMGHAFDGLSNAEGTPGTPEAMAEPPRSSIGTGYVTLAPDPDVLNDPEFAEPAKRPPEKCPTCDSPSPALHPAMQWEGEVQPCRNAWHGPLVTAEPAKPGPGWELVGACEKAMNEIVAMDYRYAATNAMGYRATQVAQATLDMIATARADSRRYREDMQEIASWDHDRREGNVPPYVHADRAIQMAIKALSDVAIAERKAGNAST